MEGVVVAGLLRVVTWNIAEGTFLGGRSLDRIGELLRPMTPDVLLLNELKNRRSVPLLQKGVRHPQELAALTGLAHVHWLHTGGTGILWRKAVAVISRLPLGPAISHVTPSEQFGTLETSVDLEPWTVTLMSTRLSPIRLDEQSGVPEEPEQVRLSRAGHEQLAALTSERVSGGRHVIAGGDFNVAPDGGFAEHRAVFREESRMLDALDTAAASDDVMPNRLDYVYHSQGLRVHWTERRHADPNPSDHPWVLAEFRTDGWEQVPVAYGRAVRLRHARSNATLHSHDLHYTHPGSSRQQQVTGFDSTDDNDWWVLRPAHGAPPSSAVVRPGDVVRLQHQITGRNLHSHTGHPSPVTGQQEVTCFGDGGDGDLNDDWTLETSGAGDSVSLGSTIRLVHRASGAALHSHWGFRHPTLRGQQEVTALSDRDPNDDWRVVDVR